MRLTTFRAIALFLLLFAPLACDGLPIPTRIAIETAGHPPETLTIFAAASATNALDEIHALFNQKESTKIEVNYASSAALAQQILAGADADLFLSANEEWMNTLDQALHVSSRTDLLGNRLVAIVPAQTSLSLQHPPDLAQSAIRFLALANPDSVPAGIYARQALVNLGLFAQVEPRIVRGGDVRQTLAFVETGQADAGIVYATDAAISSKVRVAFTFDPAATDDLIVYPLAIMKAGEHKTAAGRYYQFLQGAAARAVFERYGFTMIESLNPAAIPDDAQ